MDASKMLEILKADYGINTPAELDAAIEKFAGLDIGILVGEPAAGKEKQNVCFVQAVPLPSSLPQCS